VVARDPALRDFLGAKIKNVVGLGEVSAYGLPGEAGVILVQVPAASATAKFGLKEGDVILKCQTRDISTIDDVFKIVNSAAKGTQLTMDIWRLQRHISVTITAE
jgi:S1-C subfamily serine protease